MEYALSELFTLQMGKTPSRDNSSYWGKTENNWISIADLTNSGKYISNTKETLSDSAIAESGIKKIPANTVIMSFKLSLGKVAITEKEMYSNEAIMAFIDKGVEKISPEYLYYLLRAKDWSKGTNKAVMGATLNKATLSTIKIQLHEYCKQLEIVNMLNRVSSSIELRQQQLTKLDELVKARFVEMFGDPVNNPMGWQLSRFDDICENLDARRIPITEGDRKKGAYPYYGASGIVDWVDSYIFDENLLLVSEDGANLLMRSTPIAFSVSGKVWVNNHAHVVRFQNFATQKFIETYFALIDISEYITGTAQPKLNQAKLNAMEFFYPPLSLQNQFAAFVEEVDKSKVEVQKALDQTQLLFDSLMQQYFG